MKNVRILLIFNTLSVTALMAFVPVIGPIIRELGLSEWHGGLVVTIAGLVWMLSARPWGRLSDRRGRKAVLAWAGAGYILSYIALASFIDAMLHTSLGFIWILAGMLLLRAMTGGFYAAIPVVSAAQIADVTAPEKRGSAMAMLGAASAMGIVLGPVLGGLLAAKSLTLPLYVSAALPVLGIVLLLCFSPNTSALQKTDASPTADLHWNDPRLRLPTIAMFMAMGSVIVAQMSVGFFAIDRLQLEGKDAARIASFAMIGVGVALIAVQGSLGRFQHLNSMKCLLAGTVIAACGFVAVCFVHSATTLVISYMVMAAGIGFVFPSLQTLTANSVEAHEQGVAAGTLSASQAVASVAVPLISTLLYEISPVIPYLTAAVTLLLLALLIMLRLPNKNA